MTGRCDQLQAESVLSLSGICMYGDHGDADESFLMSMEQLIPHIGDRMIRKAFELQMEKVRNRD